MKIKQLNKMKPSISKTILFFGCLFAVINLYGQEPAPDVSPEPAQSGTRSAEGPFILRRESNTPAVAQTATQPMPRTTVARTAPMAEPVEEKPYFCRHELSIWGAGGFSTLYYDPGFGDWNPELGGAFGLGYTFYFSRHFGLLLGGEVAYYSAEMKVNGLTDSYDIIDPTDGNDVNFRTRFSNYKETQQMFNVNIPVAFQYQTGGKHKFFASLGFKLGIPVYSKYKVSDGSTFVTSGYYPVWNQEFFDPTYLGYGTFNGSGSKKDIDFDLAYMGTVEAGVKWRLSRVLSLYTGLYFEYGFNDIADKHDDRFLAYNTSNPENFTVNSTLTSQYTKDGETESFVDRVSPAAAGLKIRLGINLCKKPKEKEVVQETVVPEPPKKVKPIVAPKEEAAEESLNQKIFRTLPDEEMEEDLRRAVSEYGSAVRGTITIELEGYELDQSTLSSRMEKILAEKAAQIRNMYGTNIMVVCEGHTCDLGSEGYNMKLGQKRAEVVRKYLIEKEGYDPKNVVAISKGESSPIVPNTSEANRKMNRRVVLIIRDL